MILADTGPLVALFDPKDRLHGRCREVLSGLREPICTTVPVLTEAFHMLTPASIGSDRLRDFIARGGLTVWFLDQHSLGRAFELMEQYGDHVMDLADASLVAAAEVLKPGRCSPWTAAISRSTASRRGTAICPSRSSREPI